MSADAGDGAFVYTVTCADGYPPKRPAVACREA